MARLGMDVDQVETIGKQLQTLGAQIESLEAQIHGKVNSLTGVWDGQDATTFVHTWWPEHKKNLHAAAEAVKGLGQSALNNASDQRNVSGH